MRTVRRVGCQQKISTQTVENEIIDDTWRNRVLTSTSATKAYYKLRLGMLIHSKNTGENFTFPT